MILGLGACARVPGPAQALAVALQLALGLRSSEVLSRRVRDLDDGDPTVRIRRRRLSLPTVRNRLSAIACPPRVPLEPRLPVQLVSLAACRCVLSPGRQGPSAAVRRRASNAPRATPKCKGPVDLSLIPAVPPGSRPSAPRATPTEFSSLSVPTDAARGFLAS